MTEDATAEAAHEPVILYTAYLSSAEEVVEHLQAADTLGLGVRVESYTVPNPEGGSEPEWRFELLTDMPVRDQRDDI